MAFLNEVKQYGEIKVDGVLYRYRFNEIRRKVGNYWVLVAKYINGAWEVV